MIRIPLQKVYRAFRELDAFPDHECERFVMAAVVQRRWWEVLAPGVAGVVTAIVGVVPGGILVRMTRTGSGFAGLSTLAVLTAIVGGLIIVPGVVGLLTRDRLLIQAIRRRIDLAACTQCRFSLLGLPVKDGGVRCPECGLDIDLAAIGLRAEDLLRKT